MQNKIPRLARNAAGLLIIDIQERLLPQIFEKDRLIANSVLLIKAAALLRLPVFATEQYRKGLGVTAPEVAAAIATFALIEKVTFSACGAPGLLSRFKDRIITDVFICCME